MKILKALIGEGRREEARRRLRELVFTAERYAEWRTLSREHARLLAEEPASERSDAVKIALLGVGTTDLIEPALSLALESRGIVCEIQRADYGAYAREMLDRNSATARFDPDLAVVVNSPMSLPARPAPGQEPAEVDAVVDEVVRHWLDLCSSLHANAGCEIVLDNFHMLPLRPLGNLAPKAPWDTNSFLRRVNQEIGARAPAFVHLCDVESLAADRGLAHWFDPRLWYHAKLPVALECVPAYARNVSKVIAAIYGRSAKCLVLDLDNTLWGGVIGDDGLDGIRLGQGDAEGEAFLAFQQYVRELMSRGVLLAVASKNEERTALEVFEKHPDMQISREDIVSFHANWRPKPESLRAIARELGIGLDALVFVDDNPAERDIVRQWLPEVRVVELTEDVADYPRILDETGWFESVHISAEDQVKTQQYSANAARAELAAGTGDYDAYLESLVQVAVVAPYRPEHLDRITQLVNKSNQFNLVTRRQTRTEVEQEMRDPNRVTATVRLSDRFGDNGLICVLSARREAGVLEIDQWLMSCRVLHRGIERLLLNQLIHQARRLGVEEIRGTFVPTAKNSLVREHYASLGFELLEDEATREGATRWRLPLAGYSPFEVHIDVVEG